MATMEMLQRITAPGAEYSADFVREFRVFTGELRDFFNAGSLADLLRALHPSMDDADAQVWVAAPGDVLHHDRSLLQVAAPYCVSCNWAWCRCWRGFWRPRLKSTPGGGRAQRSRRMPA